MCFQLVLLAELCFSYIVNSEVKQQKSSVEKYVAKVMLEARLRSDNCPLFLMHLPAHSQVSDCSIDSVKEKTKGKLRR